MSTPLDRITIERDELEVKVNQLQKLLDGGKPKFISYYQWSELDEQYKFMWSYLNVLNRRIRGWDL